MIGLKRGTVQLCEHEKEWEIEAQNTIARLKEILGDVVKDIQHVGSTSILTIKAQPIIDIAVAVGKFDDIVAYEKELKDAGFYYRPKSDLGAQLLFASGSLYEGTGDLQTHFIHVVLTGSMDWINYINFRDYLNKTPSVAKEYEDLKVSLTQQAPIDSGREKYLKGKHDFIVYTLRKALVKSYIGKTVNISIDRPIGSIHPKHNDIIYPINYGFIPKVLGGDGEELLVAAEIIHQGSVALRGQGRTVLSFFHHIGIVGGILRRGLLRPLSKSGDRKTAHQHQCGAEGGKGLKNSLILHGRCPPVLHEHPYRGVCRRTAWRLTAQGSYA